MTAQKVIYDLGSNNGDDIPYYLLKCDLVVAVEANPILCKHIEARFSDAIQDGRLVVENYVLDTDQSQGNVSFYIHRTNHVLSQGGFKTEVQHLPPSKVSRCKAAHPSAINNSSLRIA